MTTPRIRNRYLYFDGKIKKKRKLRRRKRTRRKRDGAAFLGPILASAVAPVLKGIIGKIFQNDILEKEKSCSQKNKKRYKTKRRRHRKSGFIDLLAPFKIIEKIDGFLKKHDALQEITKSKKEETKEY